MYILLDNFSLCCTAMYCLCHRWIIVHWRWCWCCYQCLVEVPAECAWYV